MPSAAKKSMSTEAPIDLNEASAEDLRHGLPGIGEVLALRIVAYRDEHGPFSDASELSKIPGVTEKRLSKIAPRVSVNPPASRTEAIDSVEEAFFASSPPSSEVRRNDDVAWGETPLFTIPADLLRRPDPPSMSSLLPEGGPFEPGASILSASSSIHEETRPERSVAPSTDDEPVSVPMRTPLRYGLALGAIGLFATLIGAVVGIRSQLGAPTAQLEHRVVRTQEEVLDMKSSVRTLQAQSAAFASSISALDARLAEQEAQRGRAAEKPARHTVPAHPTPTHVAPPAAVSPPSATASQSSSSSAEPARNAPPVVTVDTDKPEQVKSDVEKALKAFDSMIARAR